MSILPQNRAAELRDVVAGRVLLPEDPDFAGAHRPWNLAVAQDVLAVVEAATADDVAALLRWAHRNGVAVATQPSGHGATGNADGAVLLRTTRLDSIEVDPAARTARIGAGVRSGELQQAVARHGLTALPGSSPVVSVTGAALGGGLSWFGRAFGWIADGILAADVVTADGTEERVTPESDPDLFRALGGGAGDVVVVTALELRLHPATEVFGGRMLWPANQARAVTEAFRAMTPTAPDRLTLWLELLAFPGAEPMVALDCTYLGSEPEGRELMQAFSSLPEPMHDSRAAMSVADLGAITAEPTEPGHGASRAELLSELDDRVLGALLAEPIEPLMVVQLRHLGGALAGPTGNPHGPLTEPYSLYMFGAAPDAEAAAAVRGRQARMAATLPVSGRKPVTFLNPGESLADALPPAALQRLAALKETRDPRGTVRGNFSARRR